MLTMNDNYKKFLLLWLGQLVSSIGGGLTSFGLSIYVFNLTGKASHLALITLLAFLPTVVLSVPAGILADKYDRRTLMMVGDGVSGLGIAYILACIFAGKASISNIGVGVFFSSVFSALLEPSYRATVTDLLTEEEYLKASGMISLAGSARYLFSPVLAGFLLAISDIKLLLFIDIGTFIFTVLTTGIVKKGMLNPPNIRSNQSFFTSFKDGWQVISEVGGLLGLILLSSAITFCMGIFQVLIEPIVLTFTDTMTLGLVKTICASGMLVSSLYLGVFGIKSGYVKWLSLSLTLAGVCMALFGIKENVYWMIGFGFLFFVFLPVANACLDYLVRTNILIEKQGRAWGFTGFISQIGYLIAYAISGNSADFLANQFHVTIGRGATGVVVLSGALLFFTALIIGQLEVFKSLEKEGLNYVYKNASK